MRRAPHRSVDRRAWLLGASALLLLAGALGSLAAQGISGREAFDLPTRTDAGSWAGTWYYVSRDSKVALWIREADGRPELKLRYLNTGHAESFETDWGGSADYYFKGRPGRFSLELTERNDKTIRGSWQWVLGHDEMRRTETARIMMYRAGDGRALVMNFEDLERSLGGEAATVLAFHQVWTFRKASNRERLWEELPF
jgi:hypothetical protein